MYSWKDLIKTKIYSTWFLPSTFVDSPDKKRRINTDSGGEFTPYAKGFKFEKTLAMQPEFSNMRLNEQQVYMLSLFKNPMPEEDFLQMKELAVQLMAKKIDDEMERLEKEKGWTQETYKQWGKEHMRTPYKK